MNKRLYRSRTDSTIGGVCGGLGEYFNIDPTFVRIIAVLLVFADGVGILGYLVAWIIIPRAPLAEGAEPEKEPKKAQYAPWNKYIPGGILILLGVFFIVREHYWWWDIGRFWPLLLIVFGLFLILRLGRHHQQEEGTNEPSQV